MQQGPYTEIIFDGLVKIVYPGWQQVWARPNYNASNYRKIIFAGSERQYRLTNQPSGLASKLNSQYDFAIIEENRAKLEALVKEEFGKELAKVMAFDTVHEPGLETL